MEDAVFSCRRCRNVLFSCQQVRDCHNKEIFKNEVPPDASDVSDSSTTPDKSENACKNLSDDIWYISEENLSPWMKDIISQADWIKGKLHCPKCSSRLGSFNFVGGSQCSCGDSVLPPVHIVKSKTDTSKRISVHIVNHAEGICKNSGTTSG